MSRIKFIQLLQLYETLFKRSFGICSLIFFWFVFAYLNGFYTYSVCFCTPAQILTQRSLCRILQSFHPSSSPILSHSLFNLTEKMYYVHSCSYFWHNLRNTLALNPIRFCFAKIKLVYCILQTGCLPCTCSQPIVSYPKWNNNLRKWN